MNHYPDNQGRCHTCGIPVDISHLETVQQIERLTGGQIWDLDKKYAIAVPIGGTPRAYMLMRTPDRDEMDNVSKHRTAAGAVLAWLRDKSIAAHALQDAAERRRVDAAELELSEQGS